MSRLVRSGPGAAVRVLVRILAPALVATILWFQPALGETVAPDMVRLPEIDVYADKPASTPPPIVQKYKLPQTSASVTSQQIKETINTQDTEDAIKYLPSLSVNKRSDGDSQPVLATRSWGVNSSARTLVYADDVLLSALFANNFYFGAPRWGMVAPEEIERIDFLYGPFAAAYPGNSMGGVLQITTRMPDRQEVDLKHERSISTFDQFGTNRLSSTGRTSGSIGDRINDFSWFISGSYLDTTSQPLAFITSAVPPPGTTGTILARNKTGAVADVVGAGGLLHSEIADAKLKLAYDFTSWMRATYTLGFYSNNTTSTVQSYLTDASGGKTFGGVPGFASNAYIYDEKHVANSLALATDTHGVLDMEAIVSNYDILRDVRRSPYGVGPIGATFTPNGFVSVGNGTHWTNADIKSIWRPAGAAHEVSFGLHADEVGFHVPVYAIPVWNSGQDTSSNLFGDSKGKTRTGALWAQDSWRFAPSLTLTVGDRLESWAALDGFNLATIPTPSGGVTGATAAVQPRQNAVRSSPKATLAWDPGGDWLVKASFGEANRFPTVSELYQIVQTGSTYQVPNANLRPEQAFSEELTVERHWSNGQVRLSLFQDNTNDALIPQTNFLPDGTPVTFVVNVDAIRNRGAEFAARQDDVWVSGLELSGSATYVDSRVLSDPSFASTTGTTATGKRVPYVPDWRATLAATYRPNAQLALTLAARYSGRQYSTLDNTDTVPHVYGAFDRYFVADARLHYAFDPAGSLDLGIDNINNDKYFQLNPFPGRTFYADATFKF